MRIAIVDDEKQARLNLRALLTRYCPNCQVVGEADGVQSGVDLIPELSPEVVLLDIEMLDGTGFDLLNQINPFNFQVVFITSHDQFAIKAFKYDALDYILKPIDPQDLIRAMQKAENVLLQRRQIHDRHANSNAQNQILTLTNAEGTFFLRLTDIIRLEGAKNYTTFHLTDNESLLTAKTIGSFENSLTPFRFFRPHQSHLINLGQVHSYQKESGGFIQMVDGSIVPLAKRKKQMFKKLWGN